MKYSYWLIAFLLSLCAQAQADWFLRGTHNAWTATPMESVGNNTMQLKGVVFSTAGSIKFDRFGNWAESYGVGGLNGNNIAVAAGTWDIKFFTDSKAWSITATPVAATYHVRGTFNAWAEGTLMAPTGTSNNYERCVNFTGGDANGGPRFKIDPNGGWGDGLPAADFAVATGWVKIVFNSASKTITAQQNLASNCGAVTSASSSSSQSSSSTISRSASTSSVAASIYHLRGTFNNWVEGTLMSRLGSSDNYQSCINFTGTGTRFKIDPNGGWGDGIPSSDYTVSPGWVKISFNSTSKAIATEQNLAANCAPAPLPEMTLSVANNNGRAYAGEAVSLNATITSGSAWQYEWKLIEDGTYNRKDIYDLTWDSDWGLSGCAAYTENVGQRITGKLYPPTSGMYKFAVAADDQHEMRITKNGIKQLLTSSTQAVGSADFSNTSQLIELSAGSAYPFEFLYINQGGSAHFSVLWQKPGSSQWEEVPAEVFSKPEGTTASGVLLQETFNQSLSSFNQLKALPSFINSRSNANVTVFTGQTISFAPTQTTAYTFEVTATSGATVVKNTISFFAEGRLISEDAANAANAWRVEGYADSSLLALAKLTTATDGTASGKVLEISAPAGGSPVEWTQTVFLKPYTAYEVRARVRLLNAPSNIQVPSGIGDSERLWKLPRLRVGINGDASQQGINAANPSQWREVAVDFAAPFNGKVDLHLHMGAYSGTFQVDNIRIEKLSGNGITQYEFSNLVANVYDNFVIKAGGYEVTKNYFSRLSRAAENMRVLSGKNAMVQCAKQNIFIPRNWHIMALGYNINGTLLKDSNLLTDSFLRDIWGSSNIVGGVMIHELEHSFDVGVSFQTHLPLFMQVYAMERDNLLRTHGNDIVNAREWIAQERATKSICSTNSESLLPKFYEFQDRFLAQDKWSAFRQIMHDRWSPYKKVVEGRAWPDDGYGQYRKWWSELQSYTGIDGWNLMHTPAEQSTIQTMFQRRWSPVQANVNAETLSSAETTLYLNRVNRASESVGYGSIDINDMVKVDGECRTNNIYAHAPSSLAYQLNKKWLALDAQAVIKDNSASGRVVARVLGDGAELYRSPSFTATSSPTTSFVVDISNVNELKVEFLDDGNQDSDWSVWIDPRLSRGTSAASKFNPVGKLIKHSSGKCVAPQSGAAPRMNEPAVLSSNCSSNNNKFKLLASGAMLHIDSGMCLHPDAGSGTPNDGTKWVFFPNCIGGSNIQYQTTALGSIKHRSSGKCMHPEGGAVNPAEGTPLVFNNGCDQERLRFSFE
ncbi:MAG TPA: NPCBM/NEW2 domain-containing protein [Cellvibrio sp.]|nr:NPCBM/NEW2 domain-containing protein [Cellvibrio sp.]